MPKSNHKAGFVNIVGNPNAGKSTLMNALVGERISIITAKAQTTRHRIMGILSGDNFQIVYSDTPGIIKPQYALHKSMMHFVNGSLEDADIILLVVDINEKLEEDETFAKLSKTNTPVVLVINKIDLAKGTQLEDKMQYFQEKVKADKVLAVSALEKINIDSLFGTIMDLLPEHPPYFPQEELTDKPERFFASEIIREQIFLNYKKEVPYSCEIAVTEFKEDPDIIRMRAVIFVERKQPEGHHYRKRWRCS